MINQVLHRECFRIKKDCELLIHSRIEPRAVHEVGDLSVNYVFLKRSIGLDKTCVFIKIVLLICRLFTFVGDTNMR
jgi:hypothetical protein